MTNYRLYTSEVEKGITYNNDKHYNILHIEYINDEKYAIIHNTTNACTPFIVAYRLEYQKYYSIEWEHGHYFTDLINAVDFIKRLKIPFDKPYTVIED